MKVEDPEQALTQAVCSRVREQLNGADAELAEAFARQFYRWVAPEDVAERDPLDLYGVAVGTFNFARERPAGTTKVRVYHPRFEEHGWQSPHTAVEIVTDDRPVPPHGRRDRDRRHAVPHRLHQHGAEPPRLRGPPDHPPRAVGAPRRRRAAARDPRSGRGRARGRPRGVGGARRGGAPDRRHPPARARGPYPARDRRGAVRG